MAEVTAEYGAAMAAAVEEAQAAGADYLGTEHLLLGVLRQERAAVTQILAGYGITYQALRRHLHGAEASPAVAAAPAALASSATAGAALTPMTLQLTPRAAATAAAARTMTDGPVGLTQLVAAILAERGASEALIEALVQERGAPPHTVVDQLQRDVRALLDGPTG